MQQDSGTKNSTEIGKFTKIADKLDFEIYFLSNKMQNLRKIKSCNYFQAFLETSVPTLLA